MCWVSLLNFQGTHIWQDNILLHNKIIFLPLVSNLFKSCVLNLWRYVRGWKKNTQQCYYEIHFNALFEVCQKQQHGHEIFINPYIWQLMKKSSLYKVSCRLVCFSHCVKYYIVVRLHLFQKKDTTQDMSGVQGTLNTYSRWNYPYTEFCTLP